MDSRTVRKPPRRRMPLETERLLNSWSCLYNLINNLSETPEPNMNKILGSQLDRVEAAMTTLVDSITSYNPSITAAQELISAEDDLMLGLEKLQTHQANHLRIQALKAQADALSSEIKETTSTLTALRKEVLALPITTASQPQREIPYSELLNFATNIAPHTRSSIPFQLPPIPPRTETKSPPSSPRLANGIASTSFADQPSQLNLEQPSQPTAPNPFPQPPIATQSLSRDENVWLNVSQNLPVLPWPGDELLSMGGLATIQGMVERGEDLGGGGANKEEEVGDVSTPEDVRVSRRRESFNGVSSGGRREEGPVTFTGLDLYDPDEDG